MHAWLLEVDHAWAALSKGCMLWTACTDGQSRSNRQELIVWLQEDWIGLRKLDEQGKLEFQEVPGGHMHFSLDWCVCSPKHFHAKFSW